jgi:hypothetical protein
MKYSIRHFVAALALVATAGVALPAQAEHCISEFNLATVAYRGQLPGIDGYLAFCSELQRTGDDEFAAHVAEVAVAEDWLEQSCIDSGEFKIWALRNQIDWACDND